MDFIINVRPGFFFDSVPFRSYLELEPNLYLGALDGLKF